MLLHTMGLQSVIDSWRDELHEALLKQKQDTAVALAHRIINRLDQSDDDETEEAWALNAKADVLCLLERLAEAQALYERAVHIYPNYRPSYETLATLLLHTNQPTAFADLAFRGAALFPDSGLLQFYAAKAALSQQDYQKAQGYLEATTEILPDHAEAQDSLGVIYQMQGRFREAALRHNTAVKQEANHAGYAYNLATAMDHLGDRSSAEKLYEHVVKLSPRHSTALANLAVIRQRQGHFQQAESLFLRALDVDPKMFTALMGLAGLRKLLSKKDEALRLYKEALSIKPEDPSARFMVDTLSGRTPDAPPQEYVAELFDDFAEDFERKLVRELRYQAPELVWQQVSPALEAFRRDHSDMGAYVAMDVGAGTGLFGKYLKGHVTKSIGVDLSRKMLDKAQALGIYDEVIVDDLTKAMDSQPEGSLCLVASVDTFVYLGELTPAVQAAARALHMGGILAFTVEALEESSLEEFELRDTSRYAHKRSYLQRILAASGFHLAVCDEVTLRYNKDAPIHGYVCLAIAGS